MIILVLLLTVLSSFLLYKGWKSHHRRTIFLGWVGLLLTLPLWKILVGAEFSIIFTLCVPAIAVWIWILKAQKKTTAFSSSKQIIKPHSQLQWHTPSVLKHSAVIVYHFILLLLMSSVITIALVDLFPILRSSQIAIAIIVIPIIWAILSFYHLVSIKKWQSVVVSLLITSISALYLFV